MVTLPMRGPNKTLNRVIIKFAIMTQPNPKQLLNFHGIHALPPYHSYATLLLRFILISEPRIPFIACLFSDLDNVSDTRFTWTWSAMRYRVCFGNPQNFVDKNLLLFTEIYFTFYNFVDFKFGKTFALKIDPKIRLF